LKKSNVIDTASVPLAKKTELASPDAIAREIVHLADMIRQRENELLSAAKIQHVETSYDKDGIDGVIIYLDRAAEKAEGIDSIDFNKKILVDDIKKINIELRKFNERKYTK
jgi:hypothetical protein